MNILNWFYINFGWLYHYRCNDYAGKIIEWSDKIGWHRIE